MTGSNDTDIRLSDDWQLTRAADGGVPLCSGFDCLYQSILLESLTKKGDMFYDPDFGWDLYDFIQSEDNELIRLEMVQRARTGLQKHIAIEPESIQVEIKNVGDSFFLICRWKFRKEETFRKLNVIINAIEVEVADGD